ncbi:hypothetical protein [Aestuariivirga sp.]|uniref:hypothetical protein n=1 Tax=Aestuariivirga sp. TaxID=2650926 RepID=UPI0039E69F48
MLTRALAMFALAVLLCGCVLDAPEPLFKEAEGEMIFGKSEARFEGWALDHGTWSRADKDAVLILTPEGQHYVMKTPDQKPEDGKATVLAVSLQGGWYGLQVAEDTKPPIYAAGKFDGKDFFVTPIMCSDLKKKSLGGTAVTFDGIDCHVKAGQDGKTLLRDIAGHLDPPEMKLVPAP